MWKIGLPCGKAGSSGGMNKNCGQRGSVLVMVLLIILIFSVFISGLALILLGDMRMSNYNYLRRQAALNAESAIAEARALIERKKAAGEEVCLLDLRSVSGEFPEKGTYEISEVYKVSRGSGEDKIVYYQLEAEGQVERVKIDINDRYYVQY